MKRIRYLLILKYTLYTLLLLLLYILQTTPRLFEIAGAKPMLVIPAALSIAMVEGEFVGGIYGALAGLLCDLGASVLFGFHGLLLALFCIGVGLLVIYLMHCNIRGALLFVTATMLVRGGIEYLFSYRMWGYENVWKVFAFHILPMSLYTILVTPLLFWLIRWIYRLFQKRLTGE
ncbi:MAG: hypothetical protein ACOX0K_11300 [Oscillospiraceae bacterium]|jgi:cell shape-determining protein MreD